MLIVSFIVTMIVFCPIAQAQVDPKKLDSLSKSIDSSAKAFRSWQDSFAKSQEIIYQTAISKNNSQNSNQTLTGQRKQEIRERQRTLLRFLAGIAVVIIGVIVWFLKKNPKT